MKFIYIVNSSSFFCSHFLTLAEKVSEQGHSIYVIAGDDVKKETIEEMGFFFIYIPLSRSGVNPLSELSFIMKLREKIRNIAPDVIHSFTVKPIIYTGLVIKSLKIKKVSIVCNSITGLGSAYLSKKISGRIIWSLLKLLYKIALSSSNSSAVFENEDDRLLFVSQGMVDANKVYLVNGAGIDTKVFLPSNIKSERATIVLVARLLKDKGIAEYIEAGKILYERKVDVCLQLVGDIDAGNISSMSVQDIQNAHNAGYIQWLGPRTDIAKIYSHAHIACLPSYREGLPKSLIEAASCGLPIITTNVPGCRQMVINGENGLLVEAKSGSAIYEAITYLLTKPELMNRMALYNRKIAIEKFDHKHIVNTFFKVYKLN
ncbi:glycosyltransferase family 4 protein [Aeromonas hydrophila]|uniref:glycosyltransferase family 4 protein n=1 Tax=Aeromonas hydrophila TaxID=644 RepID=UPI0009B90887|nr:glycosyltransferase family 4 protein [Aeromonas hydrophila]